MWTAEKLIEFESSVARAFENREIPGPVHLSGGNEAQLIELFKYIRPGSWVLSTWRNRYHALLHGVPPEEIWSNLRAGRSMNLRLPQYRFLTSAIAGGIVPLAVGLAAAEPSEIVWCFVGDMTARMGVFREAAAYTDAHHLPLNFIVEDNGYSTDTPTAEVWPGNWNPSTVYRCVHQYKYERKWPHMGIGKWVQF